MLFRSVRLLIYSKRFIIYTMRLVGATPSFIRRPFIRYNILTGITAGVIAIFMLMGSLYYVKSAFSDIEEILNPDKMMIVYGIVLASGVFLSVIAAYFAVNRYLLMARGKLYYV